MSWAVRAGRIVLVIAVIFFLAVTAALAKATTSAAPARDVVRVRAGLHLPTEWVTTPAHLLKDAALIRTRALRSGEAALVGFGVDLLTRAVQWVRYLGLAQVESHGRPTAGGV